VWIFFPGVTQSSASHRLVFTDLSDISDICFAAYVDMWLLIFTRDISADFIGHVSFMLCHTDDQVPLSDQCLLGDSATEVKQRRARLVLT